MPGAERARLRDATNEYTLLPIDDLDVTFAEIELNTRRPKLFENQLLIGVYAQTVVAKIDAHIVLAAILIPILPATPVGEPK